MNTGNRGKGRPKGAANKTTKQAREVLTAIIDGQIPHAQAALDSLRKRDPKGYIDALTKLAEFVLPKLNRTQHAGDDENPLQVNVYIPNNGR